MTYIELINRFWDFYRDKKFSDIDTAIYFFLLNECNIRKWLNPFELQTRNIEICFNIPRKTIGEARNRLKQRGVIDFIEAQGRGPTIYFISDVKVTNEPLYERFCDSQMKQKSNTKSNTKGNANSNTNSNTRVTQRLHKGNTTANSTLYIEDERYKTKERRTSRDVPAPPQPIVKNLFAEEEKKAAGRKPKTPRESAPNPPSYEEVRQYFLLQDADKLLEDWEESCRRFFDYFTAVDWKDKFNRRITRWDSRANSWILDDEKRQKEKKANEIQNKPGAVGPNAPSSGVSIRGRVTPGCGLKRRNSGGET